MELLFEVIELLLVVKEPFCRNNACNSSESIEYFSETMFKKTVIYLSIALLTALETNKSNDDILCLEKIY